jgi:actin-related protein 5
MTITAINNLLPARVTVNPTEKRSEKPPPQLHSVQEWPFKGYQPPQPEGYQQSRAHPDSAIVIDNGKRIDLVYTGN